MIVRYRYFFIVWQVIILAGAATAFRAHKSIVLDDDLYSERRFTALLTAKNSSGQSATAFKASAERYWICHPDVAAHRFFGRNGPLAFHGAREHFDRHGKREGRVWPDPKGSCSGGKPGAK
jgi:hypothetical protein